MVKFLQAVARAIGYGSVGGLLGIPCGIAISYLAGLILGHPEALLFEGAVLGACVGGITGALLSDPAEAWCAWLDSLFGRRTPEQVRPPQPAAPGPSPTESPQTPTPATSSYRPVVLFLCTANSARSQMAEAFLKKYAADRFEVHSAGLEPRDIHPLTIQVMTEAGVDISGQHSKDLRQFLARLTVHFAIIVCRSVEPRCPTSWPWALRRLEWPFDDPAANGGSDDERLKKFRTVRDQIEEQIKRWLTEAPLAC